MGSRRLSTTLSLRLARAAQLSHGGPGAELPFSAWPSTSVITPTGSRLTQPTLSTTKGGEVGGWALQRRLSFGTAASQHSSDEPHADKSYGCWKCGASVPLCSRKIGCGHCRALQPPPEDLQAITFEIFGIEPTFDIDLADLEARFRNLQREVHPDKFAGSDSSEEQSYAAQYSSQINASYRILQDPLQRASLLLRRRGVYPEKAEEQTIHDPVLLMETMEVREAIEDTDDREELLGLQLQNNDRMDECTGELSRAFASDDTAAALKASQKLSYLNRIRDEITRKL